MTVNNLLSVENLTVKFGGLTAVNRVSLGIKPGELIGLIGPNGAGKTTVFNALTGLGKVTSGSILFEGADLTHKPAFLRSRAGMARTFQNIRLFKALSVVDNLKIAYHQNRQYPLWSGILKTPTYQREEHKILERSQELLSFLGLEEHADHRADNLSYGQQRKLEIGRALITNPKLLLLDEPAAGMNPQETQALVALIRRIQSEFQVTVLLIEHDMSVVMKICEQIYVLDYGALIAQGDAEQIRTNPQVIQAYLGEELA